MTDGRDVPDGIQNSWSVYEAKLIIMRENGRNTGNFGIDGPREPGRALRQAFKRGGW
jgi:hypothetical protein